MSKQAPAHQPGTAAQGVAYLSASHAALVIFAFAVHAVASRRLGPTDYGRFVVALSTGTWLKLITLSILIPGLCKIVSEDHRRLGAALAVGRRWQLTSTAVLCLAFIAASPLTARILGDGALAVLIAVAGVEALLYSVVALRSYLMMALRRYTNAAMTLGTFAVVRAGGAGTLVLLGLGTVGAMAGLTAGPLAAGIVAVALMWRINSRTPAEPYPAMASRALSWTLMALPADIGMATLMSVDIWIVKRCVPDLAAAGLYGAAYAVSRLPDMAVQGLVFAVFARVSGALAERDGRLARSVSTEAMRYLLIVLTPICVLAAGSAKEIMKLLFSAPYGDAAGLLTTLVAAVSCAAALKVMLSLLAAADRPGKRSLLVLGLLPVGVGLCLWLTQRMGPSGAATAALITMATGMAIGLALVYRYVGAFPPPLAALRCGLAGGAVLGLGLLWRVGGLMLLPKLASLGLLYVGLLFLLGELGVQDVRSVLRAVSRRAGDETGAGVDTPPPPGGE
jgi:O-antigen/teichoic acid export membrane protein